MQRVRPPVAHQCLGMVLLERHLARRVEYDAVLSHRVNEVGRLARDDSLSLVPRCTLQLLARPEPREREQRFSVQFFGPSLPLFT